MFCSKQRICRINCDRVIYDRSNVQVIDSSRKNVNTKYNNVLKRN